MKIYARFNLLLIAIGALVLTTAGCKRSLYTNNFTQAPLDKVPEGLLVLDGGFAVKEENGNRFLELPGAPLETYGVLFGPTETNGLAVVARIHGTAKGRRFPTFGVGLNGVGGYKLQASPAKKQVELYRADEALTNAPLAWESDSWILFRLQSQPAPTGGVKVQGKVWKQGGAEPKDWQISYLDPAGPPPGRASIWGMPFAGTPLRFDDLTVTKAR